MDWMQVAIVWHSWWTVTLMIIFAGIVGYALWPRNKELFEHASRIPLEDDGREA